MNSIQFTISTLLDDLIGNYESINQPLFGKSLTTNDLLMMYENILNIILETCVNEFDMKDVHSEITKQ
ncbi:12009_t:CDS:1, partial [Funneliformis mosseae]